MFYSKFLLLMVLSFSMMLVCQKSWSMSCRAQQMTLEDSTNYLAKEKYSPFSAMKWASILGNVSSFISLSRYEKRNEREIPQWIGTGAVVMWSTSALLMIMEGGCPVKVHPDAETSTVEYSEEVRDSLKNRRATFWFMHTINTLPLLLATPYSSHDDRALILAGSILFPAVVDLAFRSTFFRSQVSPWSLRPGLVSVENKFTGQLAFSYSW